MLKRDQAKLEEAAQPSRIRIRQDLETATHRVRPLLSYIDDHLFDQDFSVKRLKRSLGLKSNLPMTRFHAELGQPPYAYVVSRRMETAAQLLRNCRLKIWKVGLLVGYENISAFSRCFYRWSRMRPSEYRRRYHSEQPMREVADMANQIADVSVPTAEAFLQDLWRLQVAVEPLKEPGTSPALPLRIEGRIFERFIAQQVWRILPDLPHQEQIRLVRDQLQFSTSELFQLLRKKSRSEGRKDRKLGVRFAELALESLNGSAETLMEDLPSLRARAWSWIGNAHWLALDYLAAEQAFIRAEEELPACGRVSFVRGEILQNKAGLRWSQREYEEALDLINAAVPLIRQFGEPRTLIQALVLRSNIIRHAREPLAAFEDLEEARRLLGGDASPRLAAVIYSSLLRLNILASRLADAEACLAEARRFCKPDDQVSNSHLAWLEGLFHLEGGSLDEAESCLARARAGFSETEEVTCVATVSLDLAYLLANQGRHAEVRPLLIEVLPVFESVRVDQDMFAGLQLLRHALDAGEASAAIIHRLRRLSVEHLLDS